MVMRNKNSTVVLAAFLVAIALRVVLEQPLLKSLQKFQATTVSSEDALTAPKDVSIKSSESVHRQAQTTMPPDSVPGPHSRILFGVFSTLDGAKDTKRREMIRNTYLNYYRNDNPRYGPIHKKNHQRNLICPLDFVLSGKSRPNECLITYAFVVGANPNGPTELLNANSSIPLVNQSLAATAETDLVHLNIRENMNEGKTQTWFKYATTIIDEQHHHFDYIAKVDTDTLVLVERFMTYLRRRLPPYPQNVRIFGGEPRKTAVQCVFKNGRRFFPEQVVANCGETVNDLYMSGELYWLSTDLARFITSDACDRSFLTVPHEDMAIGNFVNSHPKPIDTMELEAKAKMWYHDPHLKRPYLFLRSYLRLNGIEPPKLKGRPKNKEDT